MYAAFREHVFAFPDNHRKPSSRKQTRGNKPQRTHTTTVVNSTINTLQSVADTNTNNTTRTSVTNSTHKINSKKEVTRCRHDFLAFLLDPFLAEAEGPDELAFFFPKDFLRPNCGVLPPSPALSPTPSPSPPPPLALTSSSSNLYDSSISPGGSGRCGPANAVGERQFELLWWPCMRYYSERIAVYGGHSVRPRGGVEGLGLRLYRASNLEGRGYRTGKRTKNQSAARVYNVEVGTDSQQREDTLPAEV